MSDKSTQLDTYSLCYEINVILMNFYDPKLFVAVY